MTPAEQMASTLPPPPIALIPEALKACACGRIHTESGWASLPYVGEMPGAEEGQRLELRNCACESTIAVPICIVDGCSNVRTWTSEEDALDCYCDDHVNEWLRAERSKR